MKQKYSPQSQSRQNADNSWIVLGLIFGPFGWLIAKATDKGDGRGDKALKGCLLPTVIVIVAAAVVALDITKPWLYFVNREVNEAFPGMTAEQREAVANMPEEEKQALIDMAKENKEMAEQTAMAQIGDDTVVPQAEQAMPPEMPAEPVVVAQGSFIDIDPIHGAVGSATIYELPDGNRVLRFEDFRSKNGPDLHVYLSTEAPTSTFAGLGENEVHLGALKGNVGNQNYEIPAEVDLSQYRSVVIYCVPFRVVFSTAEFSA